MVQYWRVAICKYVKGRDNFNDMNIVNMLRWLVAGSVHVSFGSCDGSLLMAKTRRQSI